MVIIARLDAQLAGPGSSTASLPSGHATTGTSIHRTSVSQTVVGDEKLPRISVECLKRHPGRREEVLADGHEASRWELERAAGEPAEDPRLLVVQRFIGHPVLELAVHDAD